MPTTSKVTVPSRTSRQNTGTVATLSGLDRKEVDKAFALLDELHEGYGNYDTQEGNENCHILKKTLAEFF